MLAAYSGHTETVKMLIEAGADVNISNKVDKFLVSTEHFLIATLIHNREKRLPLCWLLDVDIQRQSRH